jgi:hypothetical protein
MPRGRPKKNGSASNTEVAPKTRGRKSWKTAAETVLCKLGLTAEKWASAVKADYGELSALLDEIAPRCVDACKMLDAIPAGYNPKVSRGSGFEIGDKVMVDAKMLKKVQGFLLPGDEKQPGTISATDGAKLLITFASGRMLPFGKRSCEVVDVVEEDEPAEADVVIPVASAPMAKTASAKIIAAVTAAAAVKAVAPTVIKASAKSDELPLNI